MASHPAPPVQLFRTIKLLASTPTSSTYLCLPRTLDPPSTSPLRVPHAFLPPSHIALLPQLMHVTTSSSPTSLRAECTAAENLGRKVIKVQFTSDPATSWVCTSPVFGGSFADVGKKCRGEGGGLPGYFLAHVFIGVLDGVREGREAEICFQGEIRAENVLVDQYAVDEDVWRWRGWPEVVIMGLGWVGGADEEGMKKDARSVLELMARGIGEWSDSVPFFKAAAENGKMETDDPMLLVLVDAQEMLKAERVVGMGEVRAKVFGRLVDIRQAGPAHLPHALTEKAHSDLVTDGEMRRALREPTVLTFNNKHEAFVRIIADEPVDMGSGGHAGMKTSRILVMRFTARKGVFSRMRGVDPERNGDSDDGLFEEDEDYGREDAH